MRLIVVAVLCLALGFGAGYAVFEKPWQDGGHLDKAWIENLTLHSNPRFKDSTCVHAHGPFYTCLLYSGQDSARYYGVTVTPDGHCFIAHATGLTAGMTVPSAGQVRTDQSLPTTLRGSHGGSCRPPRA
jgi:hypothetical protein